MIRATIGVVTNARPDHAEVMGTTVGEVAAALGATVPRSAVLVMGPTGGGRHPGPRRAGARQPCRARRGRRGRAGGVGRPALDGRECRRRPRRGSRARRRRRDRPPRDAGGTPRSRGARARAASRWPDAASTTSTPPPRTTRSRSASSSARHDRAVFVFQHRADRPARLGQFCEAAPWSQAGDSVIVTGDRPDWATWRRLRAGLPGGRASFAPARAVAAELRRRLTDSPPAGAVVFCGNTKGLRVDAIVAALQQA